MSLDLDIRINSNPLCIADILLGCTHEGKEVFGIKETMDLTVYLWDKGKRLRVDNNYRLGVGDCVFVQFAHFVSGVSLIIIEIPDIQGKGREIWASISMQGERKSDFILASCLALSLSKKYNSDIYDERMHWVERRKSNYNEFANDLKGLDMLLIKSDNEKGRGEI